MRDGGAEGTGPKSHDHIRVQRRDACRGSARRHRGSKEAGEARRPLQLPTGCRPVRTDRGASRGGSRGARHLREVLEGPAGPRRRALPPASCASETEPFVAPVERTPTRSRGAESGATAPFAASSDNLDRLAEETPIRALHFISPTRLARLPGMAAMRIPLALAAGLGSPALSQPVTESFTHQDGRCCTGTTAAGTPGLLLYFHGRSPGTQKEILDRFRGLDQEIAEEHGLAPRDTPLARAPGRDSRRHRNPAMACPGHPSCARIPAGGPVRPVQVRLQADRLLGSLGGGVLPERLHSHAGRGLRGRALRGLRLLQWRPPTGVGARADFRTRLRVLVRSTCEDGPPQESAEACRVAGPRHAVQGSHLFSIRVAEESMRPIPNDVSVGGSQLSC